VRRRAPAGFTLIEILVVVAILAIAAGLVVTAAVPDEAGVLRRESQRIGGALEHAAAAASVRAETLGVDAAGPELRFWRRTEGTDPWAPVTDDEVLAARTLPAPLTLLGATFGGRPLPPRTIAPLRASGRNEPSSYVLRGLTWQTTIALDPLNRVTIGAPVPATPAPAPSP
jgi:prepilin-type N-terminal cleavage/methylation domain-containing protein